MLKAVFFYGLAAVSAICAIVFALAALWLSLRGIYLFWTLAWGQMIAVAVMDAIVTGMTGAFVVACAASVDVAQGNA